MWWKPFGQGKNEVFPSPYVQLRLEHASLRDASAANAQIFSSRTTSAISLRETEKIRPTPPSSLPLPFPKVSAPFRLKVILAPRVVIGFSLLRIRIARHLNKCTLTLVGAQFVGALRK